MGAAVIAATAQITAPVTVVSASWMLLVAMTPPAERPYVDATTSNDVVGMVLGYNGVGRCVTAPPTRER